MEPYMTKEKEKKMLQQAWEQDLEVMKYYEDKYDTGIEEEY